MFRSVFSAVWLWIFAPFRRLWRALARITRATRDKKEVDIYIRNARRRIVHVAAARAWSIGVPWGEALQISQQAVEAGNAAGGDPFAKGHAKGKSKGKHKGIRKGKGKGRK